MSLEFLREANRVRQSEWPGSEAADVPFRAIELAGETGELMEAVKKWLRSQRSIAGTVADLSDVEDEMGDVLISLDLLAADLGIDLTAAWKQKFNKTSRKYNLESRV
jgi:NTP pyrophosphatase (non-canonical NTP hydrolase)